MKINKKTFEKSENLKKIYRSQNLAKILTEKFFLKKKYFFLKKKFSSWFFLNCFGGNRFENL